MRKTVRAVVTAFLVVVIFSTGAVSGMLIDHRSQLVSAAAAAAATPTVSETTLNTDLINQAWQVIDQNYVDRSSITTEQLTYGAIAGMVDALGDTGHSRFLSPEMVQQEANYNKGAFDGIGAEVQSVDGNVTIVAPMDGSPAQKAGLKPGDIITAVDHKNVSGMLLDQVIAMIVGKAGTSVDLTIQDGQTGLSRDLTIVRAHITVQSVAWTQIPGTSLAHLQIQEFSSQATGELTAALRQIQAAHLTGIVLDLRNNPGGLLDQAISVASQFLKSGNVMEEKDAQGNITPLKVKPGGAATDIPLIVLINKGSASASEIVASALQEAGRAQLVGETTFGTGTVLDQYNLSDGSALLMATQEWLTANGTSFWHVGVKPDVVVTLAADASPLFPSAEKAMTADQLAASQDAQLLRAIGLLSEAIGR